MRSTLLTFLLVGAISLTASAQRFLAPSFQFEVTDSMVYGTNMTALPRFLGQTTELVPQPLMFRLFSPANDIYDQRPVVIIHHTGSYMPIALNGGLTGSINDKAVTELAATFASLGYVVVTPEYRQGWNTLAPDEDEQRETLLIASLRGAQDMHMMCRYLRKTVAEDGNPLGIDAERILAIGLGTGGYNVLNANFLDDPMEVNVLDKFIDSRDGLPYYDPSVNGNVYGTDQTSENMPNWATYDNGFAMGVNLGGAMGDDSWIEGEDTEAPIAAMHSTQDANAPFGIGNILVPTTGNTVLQNSPGSRVVVGNSNMNGNNDVLLAATAQLLASGDGITQFIDARKDIAFETRSGFETTLATENMFPWVVPATSQFANEYNYADTNLLSAPVRGLIAQAQLPFTFEQLVQGEQASNRNFLDQAGARMKMDTIVRFIAPRAYAALDLMTLVDVTELDAAEIGLSVSPNPARESAILRVDEGVSIETVRIMNANGQQLGLVRGNGSQLTLDLGNIAKGMTYLLVTTNEGTAAQRLVVD